VRPRRCSSPPIEPAMSSQTPESDQPSRLYSLRFDILRNAVYHTRRRAFLDACSRVLNFLVILLGGTAAAQAGSKFPPLDQVLAGLAALIGALQLVFDLGGAARNHEFLQRRYYELLSETDKAAVPSDEVLREWNSKLSLLYAEEPPQLRALDAIAYNTTCDSLGKGEGRVRLTWFHFVFCQFYSFPGTKFSATKDLNHPHYYLDSTVER
jgi:hypothetical protein